MLHKLSIKNGIKHKNATFNFEKGLTVIKGKNGNGKSLIQEFIRFALFGTSALRGKVSDYPADMEIKLELTIKNNPVEIVRTLKDCEILSDAGTVIVKGTTPCNAWIVKELGYDLNVFDMGNAAKQMEINKLGRMKPTERKNAIDQVIGLSIISKLIKQLKDEKNELKAFVSGMESALTEPQEPIKPDNYRDSKEFKKEIDEKIKLRLDYESLLKSAEFNRSPEPFWSEEIPQGNLGNENHHKMLLRQFKSYTEEDKKGSKYNEEELRNWIIASDQWRNYKEPEISEEECNKLKKQWEDYNYNSYMEKITCPKCGHVFSLQGEIKELEKPSVSMDYVSEQEHRIMFKPNYPKPEFLIDEKFFNSECDKMARKISYEKINDELKELGNVDYDSLRKYEQYKRDLEAWNKYKVILDKINNFPVDKIVNKDVTDALELDYFKFMQYESDLTRYLLDKQRYDDNIKVVNEKRERIESCEKGILGLTNFMSVVKNSIVPSLSKVSTEIVREITDNKINEIKIEEDFSITADGKEICLLSGGEEAVINLAIRLALSSVLTRKALSVFIGDEIDQSMDQERADNTASILRKLNSQIDQIILITHKDIDGDYLIEI